MDDRRMLLLSILHQLLCCLIGLIAELVRRDLGKDAELLMLQYENAAREHCVAPPARPGELHAR
jgi:hypothetical protein